MLSGNPIPFARPVGALAKTAGGREPTRPRVVTTRWPVTIRKPISSATGLNAGTSHDANSVCGLFLSQRSLNVAEALGAIGAD
jgi:hypothetical protein